MMSNPRAPDSPQASAASSEQLLDAGLARHSAGDLAGAARCYSLAVQRAPDLARGWHLLGLTHAQAGEADDATALITRALTLDPGNAEAHTDLANLHHRAGQNVQAIASYRAAIAADATPDAALAKAWSGLGAASLGSGDTAGAIAAWRQALAIDPGLIAIQYDLACALHQSGHVDDAVAAYRAVLARQPRHRHARGRLSEALTQLGSGAPGP